MYSEYKNVKKYFEQARTLMATSKTLQEIYLSSITNHKRDSAITYLNEKNKVVSYNYAKYRSITFETASKLNLLIKEFPSNSVIGLKLKNNPEWPHIFWSILMNGFIPFLIDARLPKENTEILLKESQSVAIISGEPFTYNVKTIHVNEINEQKTNFKFAENWANEVIFCSSGTTGNVKLMVYNGANLCHQVAACLDMPETTGDIMYPGTINILAIIPFHHIFGFVAVFLWYTFFGKNIVFVRDLSTSEVFTTSQKCGVTHVYSVPLFWDSMAQQIIRKAELEGGKKAEILSKMIAFNTNKISAKEAGEGASNVAQNIVQNQLLGKKIKFCISGGGYISLDTLNVINGIGYPLYNGYGMTEAGVTSVELATKVEYRLKGSIGRPLHDVEYRLVGTTKLHPNVGELQIKSPITHIREIHNAEEKPTELQDGWLSTGDIAMMDETGFYYIKGRIKDIIINENGENVYPDEIEDYFKEVDGVHKICVLGIKKGNTAHESIIAIVELTGDVDDEKLPKVKEALDKINSTLQNEKRVNEFLIYKGKLPLTSSMKVKRFRVKEEYKNRQSLFSGFTEIKKIKTFDGYKKEDVEPIVKKMRKIFSKILLLPTIQVGDDDHWIDVLGGDSMSYVELINKVNESFEVEIPEEKYALLTTVNEFVEEILSLKGIKKSK